MISHLTFDTLRRSAKFPRTNAPLRIAARQMRWFRAAFANYVALLGEELGCDFDIDSTKLGTAFVRWLRALERERPSTGDGRREFLDFAASLMLQELVATMPLTARGSVSADADQQAAFWPEGYVLTHFCLLIHGAVVTQEYSSGPALSHKVDDIDFWWTYRENAVEDYRLASGFFQTLLGYRPDWSASGHYRHARPQRDDA